MNISFKFPTLFKKIWITIIVCGCISPVMGQSQLLRKLEKKVQQKVEDQATKRADKKLDESINSIFDQAEGSLANMGKNKDGSPIVLPGAYQFDMGITYQLKSSQKGKQEKMPETTLWFGNDAYTGMSTSAQKNYFMVMDQGNMITLMQDSKTYMALGGGFLDGLAGAAAGDQDVLEAESNSEQSVPEFKKVGTESILGKTCTIYEMEDADSKSRIWVSEMKSQTGSFMAAFAQITKDAKWTQHALAEATGMVLKVVSTDKKSKDVVEMEAVRLHEDGLRIETAGYKTMGL